MAIQQKRKEAAEVVWKRGTDQTGSVSKVGTAHAGGWRNGILHPPKLFTGTHHER